MNNYKFSMEKILNLRESQEKEKMEKMAFVQNELLMQNKELEDLLHAEKLAREEQKKVTNISDLKYKSMYCSKIKKDIQIQDKKIEKIRTKLDKKREDLISAQKDRKIMEKLKEKDKLKYITRIRQEEQKELDEIAVLRYNDSDNKNII